MAVAPMLATAGALPPEREDDAWRFEVKWDGMRAIAIVADGTVKLLSRNDNDVSVSFPELQAMGPELRGLDLVLDGEIVAFDEGRPSFERLQRRMHVTSPAEAERLMGPHPVSYLIFDLLRVDAASTTGLAWAERRELLESLDLRGPSWDTPPLLPGPGAAALRRSQELGLEGILAKRVRSHYLPGRRSADWIKVKNLRTQEVVVGGWIPGEGRRDGQVGSLLVGVPDAEGRLDYAGKVGTGFSDAALADLAQILAPLRRSTPPFGSPVPRADATRTTWVTPTLVGEVAFTEWTSDGRLRHPTWRGLRPDKAPADVVREV